MVTILDIADKLGVSKGTVSKALNGATDISETLRKTILETAVEMGYSKVRRMKDSEKKVCVLVENTDYTNPNHLGYDMVIGFRQMAEPAGMSVEVISITEKMQRAVPYDVFMLEHDYAGAFILGLSLNDPWMVDFETSRTPAVLYDNYIRANPHTAYIGVDNQEGMDLAVSYLKKLGHTKIGYLSGALGSFYTQTRHKAFFSALRHNGLKTDPSLSGNSYYISECTGKHLPRLLNMGATAILCSHDLLANAAMVQCQELGRRVPEDISIIGFDDLPLAAYTQPSLTTVRQNRTELGKCGYFALVSLLNQVSIGTMLLHPELVLRESSGVVKIPENSHIAADSHAVPRPLLQRDPMATGAHP